MTSTGLSLILAVLAGEPQSQGELLPPTPAGWRFERMDFPLSFAPELDYEGFEELRFAPGMFTPESDTYFTYVFAMKITNEATLGSAGLRSLLETYFRGLCRTVAKEKKFDIDVSRVSAKVSEDKPEAKPAGHFTATVESFDPFVTGKPLTLNLELIVVEANKTDHRIFAAISPRPTASPVWKLLRELKVQFETRSTVAPK